MEDEEELIQRLYVPREVTSAWDDTKPPPHRTPDGFLGTRDVLGRLHLRIGRVINVEEHVTDPDLYYFEYIEAGDRVSNAFVRGLNKYYAAEDFTALRVVLLYIALPHWYNTQESRVLSVLSARAPDGSRVELLTPPAYTKPGDPVNVKDYINSAPPPSKLTLPFYAPEGELLFREAPHFRVNHKGIATFKGVPLKVKSKGFVFSETLRNCPVR